LQIDTFLLIIAIFLGLLDTLNSYDVVTIQVQMNQLFKILN